MRKVLIVGAAAVVAFSTAAATAVWLLTRPAPGSASAEVAEDAPSQPADTTPSLWSPPPPPAKPPVHAIPEARPLTPEDLARFTPADPLHPYDPEADAEKQKAVRDTLQRGRRGKPPRSAEDLE